MKVHSLVIVGLVLVGGAELKAQSCPLTEGKTVEATLGVLRDRGYSRDSPSEGRCLEKAIGVVGAAADAGGEETLVQYITFVEPDHASASNGVLVREHIHVLYPALNALINHGTASINVLLREVESERPDSLEYKLSLYGVRSIVGPEQLDSFLKAKAAEAGASDGRALLAAAEAGKTIEIRTIATR